jgi:hypothetical protein
MEVAALLVEGLHVPPDALGDHPVVAGQEVADAAALVDEVV